MHELPVVLGLLDTAQRAAKENHLDRVTRIRLRIGELSDLVEEPSVRERSWNSSGNRHGCGVRRAVMNFCTEQPFPVRSAAAAPNGSGDREADVLWKALREKPESRFDR